MGEVWTSGLKYSFQGSRPITSRGRGESVDSCSGDDLRATALFGPVGKWEDGVSRTGCLRRAPVESAKCEDWAFNRMPSHSLCSAQLEARIGRLCAELIP